MVTALNAVDLPILPAAGERADDATTVEGSFAVLLGLQQLLPLVEPPSPVPVALPEAVGALAVEPVAEPAATAASTLGPPAFVPAFMARQPAASPVEAPASPPEPIRKAPAKTAPTALAPALPLPAPAEVSAAVIVTDTSSAMRLVMTAPAVRPEFSVVQPTQRPTGEGRGGAEPLLAVPARSQDTAAVPSPAATRRVVVPGPEAAPAVPPEFGVDQRAQRPTGESRGRSEALQIVPTRSHDTAAVPSPATTWRVTVPTPEAGPSVPVLPLVPPTTVDSETRTSAPRPAVTPGSAVVADVAGSVAGGQDYVVSSPASRQLPSEAPLPLAPSPTAGVLPPPHASSAAEALRRPDYAPPPEIVETLSAEGPRPVKRIVAAKAGSAALAAPVEAVVGPGLAARSEAAATRPEAVAESREAAAPRRSEADQAGEVVRRLRLELSPPLLGHVLLDLRHESGTVTAHAVVEQPATGQTLRQVEAQVQQALESQGLKLGAFDVSSREGGHPRGHGASPGVPSATALPPTAPEIPKRRTVPGRIAEGAVDLYA